jgi:hypothetical protein
VSEGIGQQLSSQFCIQNHGHPANPSVVQTTSCVVKDTALGGCILCAAGSEHRIAHGA